MTYEEIVQHLFSLRPRYDRNSIHVAQTLSQALRNPFHAYPTIHIAGTNGKGSVALKVANSLQLFGKRVGLFTSPHLFSFTERMVVNGVPIGQERVISLGKTILNLAAALAPGASFFDIMTLMAFCYFQEEKVDIAVIETGIGGRHDTTNILQPILSIITSIGEDHIPLLGTTLEEIAGEKAGIIKENTPIVLGPHADYAVIRQEALQKNAPLLIADKTEGFYDLENQSVARRALQVLQIPEDIIAQGIQHRPPCRFELVAPDWIFDVAHNPSGIERMLEALRLHYPGEPFSAVVGMSRDKDVAACLKHLATEAQHIYLIEAGTPRAMTAREMAVILSSLGFDRYTEVGKRYDLILGCTGRCVVAGTFYIMQEVRDVLRRARIIP